MSELLVFAFDNPDGANEMVGTIQSLQKQQLIQLADAAIVTRKPDGKAKVKQLNSLVGAGALVRLGGHVRTQPLDHVQRMGHWHDPGGVHRIHLLHQTQDVREVGREAILGLLRDGEAGEVRDLVDVGAVEGHWACPEVPKNPEK